MDDETRLDNELAAFTDGLLAGKDPESAPEIEALAHVVRRFHHIIDPDSRPEPAFRERLAKQLDHEWTIQHRSLAPPEQQQRADRERHSPRFLFDGLRHNRVVRLAAMAAVLTVVLSVAVLVATDSDNAPGEPGTASGDFAWPVVIGIVVVGLLGLLIFWLGQRRKS